jgi:hypothetical protein
MSFATGAPVRATSDNRRHAKSYEDDTHSPDAVAKTKVSAFLWIREQY